MKKIHLLTLAVACCLPAALLSCSDDPTSDTTPPTTGAAAERFVIAATVDGFNYLGTTDSISSGSIDLRGSGHESVASSYWIFKDKERLFALVYNKGGAGTGEAYTLGTDGKVHTDMQFSCQRFTTYGMWGDYVLTSSTGNTTTQDAAGNYAQGFLMNYLNATNGEMHSETYPAENFLGNGEKVCFSGFVEKNGKLYTSVVPMGMSAYGIAAHPDKVTDADLVTKAPGGSGSGAYEAGVIPNTQYPDSAFVAIYNNSFSERPVIARTGKIGYATGRMKSQYYQTIWPAGNGDIYVFSPGYGRLTASSESLKQVTGTLKSGVVRIKAGETDFDPSYYVCIEDLGNHHPLYRCWPISDSRFLLQLYAEGLATSGENTTELAVFDGESGTLTLVEGMPTPEQITSLGSNPYAADGAIYMPVVTNDGRWPALYRIDGRTARAERALEVANAESISAVGVLKPQP